MNSDKIFMQRALQLASLGRGRVSPNPMVGCVLVSEGQIIGEGFHTHYGAAHAEVEAVRSVADKSSIKGSTAYVTLEPCAHFGLTPPCADLLIDQQVGKVVIASVDPNPRVNGLGIKRLREAGIVVEQGLLETEAIELNKRFFVYHLASRPYIVLKWAQTADGFIARENGDSKWISSAPARQLVHKWRSEEDAIMTGKNTAQKDNPRLTVRDWAGKHPLRVVTDRHNSLSPDLHIFIDGLKTWVYNIQKDQEAGTVKWIKINERPFLEELMADLRSQKIQSVLVEGGSILLNSLIEKGLWDEARVFVSPDKFGAGMDAPELQIDAFEETKIDQDRLLYYTNTQVTWKK